MVPSTSADYCDLIRRTVAGQRIAIIIKVDESTSDFQTDAALQLGSAGATVVALEPEREHAVWVNYTDTAHLRSIQYEELRVIADYIVIGRERTAEGQDPFLTFTAYRGWGNEGNYRVVYPYPDEQRDKWAPRYLANTINSDVSWMTPAMIERPPVTMLEFVELFRLMGNDAQEAIEGIIFNLQWEKMMPAWREFLIQPINRDAVQCYADMVVNFWGWAIGHTEGEELRGMRESDGCSSYKKLRSLASKYDISTATSNRTTELIQTLQSW